jgi:hypothetical protein
MIQCMSDNCQDPIATYRRKTVTQRTPGPAFRTVCRKVCENSPPTETVVMIRLPSLYPFVVVDDLGLDWANLLQLQH